VLFDTDILIWIQRGSHRAAGLVEKEEERCISVLTDMELLQGASEKRQHEHILDFLREFSFRIVPLSENIGHRAAIYIEEYSLSHGLRSGDAIIAATRYRKRTYPVHEQPQALQTHQRAEAKDFQTINPFQQRALSFSCEFQKKPSHLSVDGLFVTLVTSNQS